VFSLFHLFFFIILLFYHYFSIHVVSVCNSLPNNICLCTFSVGFKADVLQLELSVYYLFTSVLQLRLFTLVLFLCFLKIILMH